MQDTLSGLFINHLMLSNNRGRGSSSPIFVLGRFCFGADFVLEQV